MSPRRPALLALALTCVLPTLATAATPYRSAQQILEASPDSDWRTPDPANLLVMNLAAGQVVIELAPAFAPQHVANIQTLAHEHFWDGESIYRAQDNFVVQFGDADADDAAKAKPLGSAKRKLPAEFQRDSKGLKVTVLPDRDGWADQTGFIDGFAVGQDKADGKTWLAHCYGALGAGRNNEEDSSIGAELYVVTGQSPRQLDRNITVVGRVLKGMELLSALPRGPAPMGFYADAAQRTPITSIQRVSDLSEAQRPTLQVLRTDSKTFIDTVEARRNRVDDFYKRAAGHIDLCNIPVPVR
ncbi:peptidylprolyl isomerase [Stenotrophomonas aracearum]|jgi:peptidylprolyl isomerase|uniref:peptidylprolyl isomerase n=1 Tax=Stenotrophomonas aracearum TaxID=3003272 RepID=A0ABY9YGB5_9GAMM|nr:peptidylprolyl isomerase [Stenotrophomonas sp. A5588]WNH49917.1 peptidylprolyl isomerase [Stenotrophomonas sp. A5588]